jgi:preprotein translocase subunit SecD
MASPQFRAHASIVELAEALPVDEEEVRQDGQLLAKWIECNEREFPDVDQLTSRGLITRVVNDRAQALILTNDGLDVDSSYLQSVAAEVDETGRPQVDFAFNDMGANLFGQLTGQHVPTATGQRYALGIVLDGELQSAPTIESKITNRGRISGNMAEDDVEYLVAMLNAGVLPHPVREIEAAPAAVESHDSP